MKKLLLNFILVILVVLMVGYANARIITQTNTWSTTPGTIRVTPFDRSLGTLDKITVSVDGKLQMEYNSPTNIYGMQIGLYSFDITASPQLGMGIGTYAEMYKVHGSSPGGEQGDYIITIDFAYDIVFDHTTDAAGKASVKSTYATTVKAVSGAFVIDNPTRTIFIETINGTLNDYISIASAAFNCSFYHLTAGLAGTYVPIFTSATSGSIAITYDYTPVSSPLAESATRRDVPKTSMPDIKNANRLENLAQKPSESSGQADITGLWVVTQGTEKNHHIYMYQEGGKISGMWDDRFMITGAMNGNVYTGKYYTTVNPNGNTVTMTLSPDGLNLEGIYHYSIKDHTLQAVKDVEKTAQIKALPTMDTPSPGFAGTWGTTEGDIVLNVDGTKVSGTWGDKTIGGTVKGNVLNGRYYKTSASELLWDFNMTMSPDGKTCILFHTKQGGVLINTWRK
jgi:hypothetical protein